MEPKADTTEPALLAGYLGRDEVLYCSRACATARGQTDATPVDRDQYETLVDRGGLGKGDVVCPVCGSDYPLDWGATDEG